MKEAVLQTKDTKDKGGKRQELGERGQKEENARIRHHRHLRLTTNVLLPAPLRSVALLSRNGLVTRLLGVCSLIWGRSRLGRKLRLELASLACTDADGLDTGLRLLDRDGTSADVLACVRGSQYELEEKEEREEKNEPFISFHALRKSSGSL